MTKLEAILQDVEYGEQVEIFWVDSTTLTGWVETKDILIAIENNKPPHSSGYFVVEHKGWIALALTHLEDPTCKEWNGVQLIPISQIRRIKRKKSKRNKDFS